MHLDFKFDIYGLNKWYFINFDCPFTECESGMTSSRYSSRMISNGLDLSILSCKISYMVLFVWTRNCKSNSLIGQLLESGYYWRSNAISSYFTTKSETNRRPTFHCFKRRASGVYLLMLQEAIYLIVDQIDKWINTTL